MNKKDIIKKLNKYKIDNNSDVLNCLMFSKSGRHTPMYAKVIGFIDRNDIIIVRTLQFYLKENQKIIHYHNTIRLCQNHKL